MDLKASLSQLTEFLPKPLVPRHLVAKAFNLWGPFLGAGIRIKKVSPSFKTMEVEMKLTPFNRNYVGTHFGGSLYSMVDPFYMIMLMHNLGPDYVVWDKSATIQFKKPGKGLVRAEFHLNDGVLTDIREAVEATGKVDWPFHVKITDGSGDVVAEVDKTIYVRKKKHTNN